MKFTRLIILISMFAWGAVNAQPAGTWQVQQTPTTKHLRKCVFVDTLNGWAAGDSGIILHTSNGGGIWQIQQNSLTYPIDDIFFLNPNTGWAIANEFFFIGTTILKTTNGGINWDISTFPDTTVLLRTVRFNDALNGWMAGFSGVFVKTTDGGVSWARSPVDTNFLSTLPVLSVSFYNNNIGFAGGGQIDLAGMMWRTTNSGVIWHSYVVAPEPVYDIHVFDSLNIIATGGDLEYGTQVITSSNGGVEWTYRSLKLFGQGRAITYRTPDEAWIPQSFSQTWAFTNNGGRDWITFSTPDSTAIYDAQFVDSIHGWCVGENGLIARYVSGTVGIVNENQLFQNTHSLNQNYPNPFNPFTVISYYLSAPSRVSIKIFNMLGEEVKSYYAGLQSKGGHQINFNGADLPSGVYYYSIQAGDFKASKKMLLLK